MDGLRAYVLGIVAASMLCGVLIRLTRNSGSAEIIRMLCGIFLTIVLIQPLAGKKTRLWEATLPDVGEEAEAIIAEGRASTEDIRKEFIKERLEAYILSRAEAIGADIQAEITLGKDCVPTRIRVMGSISPIYRSKLTQIITSELGIPREQQEWIG